MNSNIALVAVAILLVGGLVIAMNRNDGTTVRSDIDYNSASVARQNNSATTSDSNATTSAGLQFSAEQREILIALGVDPDAITITPEMEACAEGKLGASRMAEIRDGDTVSMTEGMQLATCFE